MAQQVISIAIFVFGCVWLFIPMKRLLGRRKKCLNWIKYIMFAVYILANLRQTIFFRAVNLQVKNYFLPFETYRLAIRYLANGASPSDASKGIEWCREFLLNILLYVPLGYLLPFLWDGLRTRRKAGKHSRRACCSETDGYVPMISGKVAGIGLLCTLTTEMIQLIFHIGTFQTDDIINNTLGCIIGCTLYEWVMRVEAKRKAG